jgi:hypothetical protein
MEPNKKTPKKPIIYFCENCEFLSSNKKDYSRHLATDKHKILTNPNEKPQGSQIFTCNCGKIYKHMSSLCAHKKTCITENNVGKGEEIAAMKEIMKYLMKENSEMKTMMIEQQNMVLEVVKNGTHNTTTTHTNSHNKAFNLQFFLNETCKEAMNIGEFVDSLKIQLSDLEKVGELGYIEGISNIIVKNLKELDVTKRPVHCTDKKRETVYIKDNNIWEKDEDKTHMHKLIKKVAFKNVNMFAKFKEEHPDCMKYHSTHNDKYNKIVYESMGGKGDNDFEKNEKIIKNVLKQVVVNKEE